MFKALPLTPFSLTSINVEYHLYVFGECCMIYKFGVNVFAIFICWTQVLRYVMSNHQSFIYLYHRNLYRCNVKIGSNQMNIFYGDTSMSPIYALVNVGNLCYIIFKVYI